MDKPTHRVTFLQRGVAWIEFTRASAMNTFIFQQSTDLAATLDELNNNPSCRVAVVAAHGPLFSAGADIGQLAGLIETKTFAGGEKEELEFWFDNFQQSVGRLVRAMVGFSKILIWAPHSGTVGISCTLAPLADYVLCSDKAYFLTPFMSLNFCAEGCSSYTFPRILGPQMARQMLLNGYKLSAEEALRYRFVTAVYKDQEFHEKVLQFATKHAKWTELALQRTKALIWTPEEKAVLLKTSDIELYELAKCIVTKESKAFIVGFANQQKQKRQQAIAEKKKQLADQHAQHAKHNAAAQHHPATKPKIVTERVDHMIANIGGWDAIKPARGGITSPTSTTTTTAATTSTSSSSSSTTSSSTPSRMGKLAPSPTSVIDSKTLQQNKLSQTKQITKKLDPGDEPIPAATKKRVPQEEKPYEPIPPILMWAKNKLHYWKQQHHQHQHVALLFEPSHIHQSPLLT